MQLEVLQLLNQADYLDRHNQYFETDNLMLFVQAYCFKKDGNVRLASKDGIDKKLIKEINHDTYILRKEEWKMVGDDSTPAVPIDACYSIIDNSYIGDLDTAKMLEKKGIIAQRSKPSHNVSSIGFSEKDDKWYGWSHRAIKGFAIGDKPEKWSPYEDDPIEGKTIKTLSDAKKAAIAFAESVS